MKRTTLTVTAIGFCLMAFSQITYKKNYNSEFTHNKLEQLLRLPGKGSLLLGTACSAGLNCGNAVYCVKADSNGNWVLAKTFTTALLELFPRGVITRDGGLLFLTRSYDSAKQVYKGGLIVKCNNNGDIEWAKRLLSKKFTTFLPQLLFEDSKGDLLLVYTVGLQIIQITKIDKKGVLKWSTTINTVQGQGDIYTATSIAEIPNKEFVIAGNLNCQWCEGQLTGSILRINDKGQVLTFKKFGGITHYQSTSVSKIRINHRYIDVAGFYTDDYWNGAPDYEYFLSFTDTSTKATGTLITPGIFSYQHYLKTHDLLPFDRRFDYYNADGSFVHSTYRNFYIEKYDSLGRICPDFLFPIVDTTKMERLFTINDKYFSIYKDSPFLDTVTVFDSVINKEIAECSGIAKPLSTVTTNNQTFSYTYNATLFPNPATNYTTLKYYCDRPTQAKISITSMDGRAMKSFETYFNKGANNSEISLTSLSPGVYFLKIKAGDKAVALKFIKN